MTTSLSPVQQQQYAENGYFFPVRVFDAPTAQGYLDKYLAFHEERRDLIAGMQPKDRYVVFSELHFVLKWVHELVTHPAILDAVESVIGPDILVWNTAWFTKMPGDKTYVSWHQDGTYWKMSEPKIVTAWLALKPTFPANGCLRVMPGTHKQPALPHRETFSPNNALSRGQDVAVKVDESAAVDICLQPGEISLHHLWTVHGSKANESDIPRIGLAIRYIAADVKQDSPALPLALLARGQNRFNHFELMPAPTEDTIPVVGGRHAEIAERVRASIMPAKAAAK